jgi:hypothetical protein
MQQQRLTFAIGTALTLAALAAFAQEKPGSAVSKLPEAQPLIMKDPNNPEEQQKVFLALLKFAASPPIRLS